MGTVVRAHLEVSRQNYLHQEGPPLERTVSPLQTRNGLCPAGTLDFRDQGTEETHEARHVCGNRSPRRPPLHGAHPKCFSDRSVYAPSQRRRPFERRLWTRVRTPSILEPTAGAASSRKILRFP